MEDLKLILPPETTVVLASGSPRRREILEQIGLPFSVAVSGAEENIPEGLEPYYAVQTLAFLKAADVARSADSDAVVIGADTVVVVDDEIIGKPKDAEDAIGMLKRLSGRSHSVLTGVAVVRRSDGKSVSLTVETKVHFRKLSEAEISSYVKTGEPLDKAGAYGIQGLGGLFVDKIEGDYYNVVGLPLSRLGRLLCEEFNFELLWEVK